MSYYRISWEQGRYKRYDNTLANDISSMELDRIHRDHVRIGKKPSSSRIATRTWPGRWFVDGYGGLPRTVAAVNHGAWCMMAELFDMYQCCNTSPLFWNIYGSIDCNGHILTGVDLLQDMRSERRLNLVTVSDADTDRCFNESIVDQGKVTLPLTTCPGCHRWYDNWQ